MANLDWRLECDACEGGTESNEDLHVSVSLDHDAGGAGHPRGWVSEPVAIELID
jgi:hypothetical protein